MSKLLHINHLNIKLSITLIGLFFFVFSCKKEVKSSAEELTPISTGLTLKYAKGFNIIHSGNHKILEVSNPWPKAEHSYKYLLLTKAQIENDSLNKAKYDGIITIPVKKIVVTSTTHIPALELLNKENALVGFPGTPYISSEKTRTRIDNGFVRELGKNEGINTEVLLELQPDLVVGFGVDGTSKSLNTIKNSGIPVIYNGDWVENSPLAKAEWIKFFGVIFDKNKEAEIAFNKIEKEYIDAKKLAATVINKPSILSGAMHKDIWYLPSGTSPEAQILKDANVNYLWADTVASGSLALSFETVFTKAKTADIWLSPSYYPSLETLKKANNHYTKFDAFQNKNMYTFSNTTGKTGGVLYYELGIARPDLVLKDIIKICHPELLKDYQPYFFKPLN